MENKYCIILIAWLEDVEVDIFSVKTYAYFELIEIIVDKRPYPSLFGIDWDFENYAIIDSKRKTMTFEVYGMQFIQPLNPYKGPIFTELMNYVKPPNLLDQLY